MNRCVPLEYQGRAHPYGTSCQEIKPVWGGVGAGWREEGRWWWYWVHIYFLLVFPSCFTDIYYLVIIMNGWLWPFCCEKVLLRQTGRYPTSRLSLSKAGVKTARLRFPIIIKDTFPKDLRKFKHPLTWWEIVINCQIFIFKKKSCFNNDLYTDSTGDDEIKTSNVDIPQIPPA